MYSVIPCNYLHSNATSNLHAIGAKFLALINPNNYLIFLG